MTARTVIRDYVIWSKHLHGDLALPARIAALQPGQLIELTVDGVRGAWARMSDGKDGRPTLGIKPMGSTQDLWRKLYEARRGDEVMIRIEDDDLPKIYPALAKTPEEREAAIRSLLSFAGRGYRSEGPRMTRDEMNQR